jgi:hypothetical protein
MRSDRMIASQMDAFAALSPEPKLDAISDHLKQDPTALSSQDCLAQMAV